MAFSARVDSPTTHQFATRRMARRKDGVATRYSVQQIVKAEVGTAIGHSVADLGSRVNGLEAQLSSLDLKLGAVMRAVGAKPK